MGSLFRSEEMCLAQLYVQSEAAYACLSELGELGLAQFKDLNDGVNAYLRKFVSEVRRCDEMERILRFLKHELEKDNITIDDNGENPPAPFPREMLDLESEFENLEKTMKEVNTNQRALKSNFLELTELKHVLRMTQLFFDEAAMHNEQYELVGGSEDTSSQSLPADENMRGSFSKFSFVAGVIVREKVPAFERVLWRACRGNVFLRYAEIETPLEDPHADDFVTKYTFIIFFQGDQLKNRVKKICEGFRATIYPCPETPQERREIAIGVMTRIEDLQTVLNQADDHRRLVLSQVACNIRIWLIKVRKMKSIYHTLNLFNVSIADKCLIAECWCPVVNLDKMQLALQRGTEVSGSSMPSILQQMETDESPPTCNKTDKFSCSFQNIIDAYGIASYREVNPAPFTIITFPFLFGVMFGDLGHGFLMFLFALYMVLYEKQFMADKNSNEIWNIMFGGRYLILLMGLFSMYSGFVYNECFSVSLNVFGSAWNVSAMEYSTSTLMHVTSLTLDPAKPGVFRGSPPPYPNGTGYPYVYGMDPIWHTATNKITFVNSYKMKLSVILGLVQMIFGLCLALCNHIHFKDRLSFGCEWIPKMLFLLAVIGYMCVLILYKWAMWKTTRSSTAPSLLIGLINMFMFTKVTTELFPGQNTVNKVIVVLAIICIPWMLLARPIILYWRNKQKTKQGTSGHVNETSDDVALISLDSLARSTAIDSVDSQSAGSEHEEEFVMSDLMINQMIHTIEFCLNCISHTASYLRLWALSLAHVELTMVLWQMVLKIGLAMKGTVGIIMIFLLFWPFVGLTIGILLVMEGLSAFLHALRLHWVEFQSKFYKGEGYMFAPFSFELIMEGSE